MLSLADRVNRHVGFMRCVAQDAVRAKLLRQDQAGDAVSEMWLCLHRLYREGHIAESTTLAYLRSYFSGICKSIYHRERGRRYVTDVEESRKQGRRIYRWTSGAVLEARADVVRVERPTERPTAAKDLVDRLRELSLNWREKQILDRLSSGRSMGQIAKEQGVRRQYVHQVVVKIREKLLEQSTKDGLTPLVRLRRDGLTLR